MKNLKIFIIDTYYSELLESVSEKNQRISFAERQEFLIDLNFGTGSAYKTELEAMGHEIFFCVPNDFVGQSAWSRENLGKNLISLGWNFSAYLARLPFVERFLPMVRHAHFALLKQVQQFKPDVIFIQDINFVPPTLVKKLTNSSKLIVGEIASPLPPDKFLKKYDLILSALPPIVEQCKKLGIKSEWLPLGFDARNLKYFKNFEDREFEVAFIGSISNLQKKTIPMIKEASKSNLKLRIYGPKSNFEQLKSVSLEHLYHGEAWGKDMFRILGNTKLVINRHGEIAQSYAVNMRMYEATGMGAALLTDNEKGLPTLFEKELELLTYSSLLELFEKLQAIANKEIDLKVISQNGHQKTISTHTYRLRSEQLSEIIKATLGSQY